MCCNSKGTVNFLSMKQIYLWFFDHSLWCFHVLEFLWTCVVSQSIQACLFKQNVFPFLSKGFMYALEITVILFPVFNQSTSKLWGSVLIHNPSLNLFAFLPYDRETGCRDPTDCPACKKKLVYVQFGRPILITVKIGRHLDGIQS